MNKFIPTYSLYGEKAHESAEFWMHAETIASRSQRYDWEIRPHRHEALFQILHIRSGHVQVTFGDDSHDLVAPCVIVIPPTHEHGFHFTSDVDGVVITVMAHRFPICTPGHPALGDWLSRPRCVEQPESHADHAYIRETIDRLETEIAQANTHPILLAEMHLTTALMMLRRLDLPQQEIESARDQIRFQAVLALIQQEYRSHRPVGFYARKLGISPTHLNRITHAFAGKSVSGLIADQMIMEAKRDLVFTARSIQQVADNLGFEDPAYFSRFFSRHTGTSPRAWRETAAPRPED